MLSILITAPLGAIAIRSLGEKVLEVSLKPEYRFKDLREKLGLARVGQRLREKSFRRYLESHRGTGNLG